MKKTVLLFLALCLFAAALQAQQVIQGDSLSKLGVAQADVATLCCDNLDVMRIEFNFDRALEQQQTLTRLDISMQHPKLTDLPPELLQFRALTYLNLSFNRFVNISPRLAALRNLQCLDLSGNYNLLTLPDFLNSMPNLKIIRLQDMPYWNDKKKTEMQEKFPNILLVF